MSGYTVGPILSNKNAAYDEYLITVTATLPQGQSATTKIWQVISGSPVSTCAETMVIGGSSSSLTCSVKSAGDITSLY